MDINKEEFKKHKEQWSNVAKENGWYSEPFYIQVWVDSKGKIVDSVSNPHLKRDYILSASKDKEITNAKFI